ncbi:NDP-hexose 2,3-dehydratase family protein [Parvularcula marina]|uniref:NDP-hexose 2,3-dehydratase family protein n=1 Tax=Parvularcula marina TaxID=2292771 RepID=UPI003516079F
MNSISEWLDSARRQLSIEVYPQDWQHNDEWSFADGALAHRSGKFFTIKGFHCYAPGTKWHDDQFPLIDQPEVGLLGFLLAMGNEGPEWLLQAKAEPGTEHHVQIGPSVQATVSNYTRAHGGKPTAFLNEFQQYRDVLVSSVEQSEQGTRFLGKFNWNAVRILPEKIELHNENWKWFSASDLKRALGQDFLVNTDSRSVIACAPWTLLCPDAEPFSKPLLGTNAFTEKLRSSYGASRDISSVSGRLLQADRLPDISLTPLPLDGLSSWRMTEDGFIPLGTADYDVRSYRIYVPGREKERWSQPLLRGLNEARAVLFARASSDGLEFFFRETIEPGFGVSLQLGPSWQSDGENPDWTAIELTSSRTPLIQIRQSDEGGRFMRSIVSYEIRQISQDTSGEGGYWLTLSQLQALCRQRGMLTNEARTLISMLLSFA